MPCKPQMLDIHPANLIRLTYIQDINTSFRQYFPLLNVHILNRQSGSKGWRFAYSSKHHLL